MNNYEKEDKFKVSSLLTYQKGTKKSVPGVNILVCEQIIEVAKVSYAIEVCVPVERPVKEWPFCNQLKTSFII